jgi:ATP-dependent helicase/nuclease subunit A
MRPKDAMAILPMIVHTAEEVTAANERVWQTGSAPLIPSDVLALRPLPSAPTDKTESARRLLDELNWQIPNAERTVAPAARAITQLTKTGRVTTAGQSVSQRELVRFSRPLRLPRFARAVQTADVADVGVAVHRALELMRWSSISSTDDVNKELQRLVDERRISGEQAAMVDAEAMVWFAGTPLGRAIIVAEKSTRPDSDRAFRELSIAAPAEDRSQTAHDPLAQTMLRGRIDLLLRDASGEYAIVDYKTDRLTPETIGARVDFYRPQVQAYATAVSRIVAKPIRVGHLVFFSIREVRTLSLS